MGSMLRGSMAFGRFKRFKGFNASQFKSSKDEEIISFIINS